MNDTIITMPNLTDRHHPYHFVTALTLLIKLGIDIHRVSVRAVGEHRNYLGEVLAQNPKPGETIENDSVISLDIGMASAVDYLPYQFFYGWQTGKDRGPGWEDDARHLMAPFDGSVARYNAIALHEQLEYSLALVNHDYLKRYLELFKFSLKDQPNDIQEALLWSAIMPGFHFWAGSPKYVAGVLHYLFGYKFEFTENIPTAFDIPGNLRSRLGQASSQLGSTWVIGRSFTEYDSGYQLTISEVPADEARDLLPGQAKRNKIEWVLQLCMPSNLECRIMVRVRAEDLQLGTTRTGLLGYSSFVTTNRGARSVARR